MAKATKLVDFIARDSEGLKISVQGTEKRYELLKPLKFTAERKMMSVVVHDTQANKYFVFSKGQE
jgi:magnesium-transporting ATPase (P-type)